MATVEWSEDPTGKLGKSDAVCRGCDKPLWQRGDSWSDSAGIEVCIKLRLEDIGTDPPSYVFHEPMPAGLRGAPA